MLQITIPSIEVYDELNNEFICTKEQTLQMEHSLVSLSKWESKWKIPFLTDSEKTISQSIDYIRCMTISQNIDPEIYRSITNEIIKEVSAYIEDSMTATTFSKENEKKKISKEIITAEIIYYWMVTFNIPFECQKWHLNRLLTLINVCNVKNQPLKKMGKKELYSRNTSLNEVRRRELNTKG